MRKRLLSILLSVLLCLALVSPQAAAADIYFVAVDDSVPLTLPSSMSPFFSGSTLYVPSSVFERRRAASLRPTTPPGRRSCCSGAVRG